MGNRDSEIEFRRSCSPDITLCRRSHLVPLLLLFVLLFIIYFNSFSGTWVFDDHHNITDNPYVHLESLDWESIKGTFYDTKGNISRPLAYLSFGINHFFHGLDEFGYHLVNFIVHCLAALFLYLFIFRLLHLPIMNGRFANRAGSIALLAAVLWATAPIQVTSVTYIVQRMASMTGMFYIMAMFFYLMGRTAQETVKQISWFVLCLVSGLLAFASKENAVLLLPTLLLYDVLLIQGLSRKNLKRNLFVAVVSLVILVVLAFVLANPIGYLTGSAYDSREFNLWERLMTQPRVLLFYLSLMVYPMTDRFTLIYEIPISRSLFSPWTTIPAILFWTGWAVLGVWLAKKRPLISFCLLFFIVNHLVESTIIPLELVYEHRNYIPSMMLFLLASGGIIAFLRDFSRKRLLQLLTCLFIVITIAGQGYSVMQRNSLFEHPLYIWSDNVKKAPGLSRGHINLGKTFAKAGLSEAAKESYMTAIKVNRYHRHDLRSVPLNNMGNYYLRTGNPIKAIEMYDQSLSAERQYMLAWHGKACALMVMGELQRSRMVLEEALEMVPESNMFKSLYSLVLMRLGNRSEALDVAREVLLSNTGRVPLVHKILGEVFMTGGDYELSRLCWNKYFHVYPDDVQTLLALVYLANIADDEAEIRRSALRIVALKGDKSWEELFHLMVQQNEMDLFEFPENPWDLVPLVRHGVISATD